MIIGKIFIILFSAFVMQSKLALGLDKDECVVNIWRGTDVYRPWGNHGHTSLETNKYYMSFWPVGGKGSVGLQPGALITSLQIDNELERKSPEVRYTLKRSNLGSDISSERINRRFEALLYYNDIDWEKSKKYQQVNLKYSKWSTGGQRERHFGAHKRGKNSFYEEQQSCITFVWNLLDAGIYSSIPDCSIAELLIDTPLNWATGLDKGGQILAIRGWEHYLEVCLQKKTWEPSGWDL